MDERSPINHRRAFRRTPTTGNPYWKRLITRSGADAHRLNTQCRESFPRTDIHMGTRVAVARNLALSLTGIPLRAASAGARPHPDGLRADCRLTLTIELHSAPSRWKRQRYDVEIRMSRTTRLRSPLECTALRLGAGAGYRRRGARIGSSRTRAIRLECASPRTAATAGNPRRCGRTARSGMTLTVGFHSISLRLAASCPHLASCLAQFPVILTCENHRPPSRFEARISTTGRPTGSSSADRRTTRREIT